MHQALFKVIGCPRTNWLIRAYGALLWLSVLFQWRGVRRQVDVYPRSFLVLGGLGVLLTVFGARLVLLVPCAVAAWWFLAQEILGIATPGLQQQSAEYPVFLLVPTMTVVLALSVWRCGGKDHSEEKFNMQFDELVVRVFRLLLVWMLFWVSFHKINWDFLSTSSSCEEVVKRLVTKRWSGSFLPWLTSLSSPALVVLMEGPFSIALLLWARRLGMVWVCLLFTMVSLVNAVVVTLCPIVCAISFFSRQDVATIKRCWRRWSGYWLLLLLGALGISVSLCKDAEWFLFGLHHVLTSLVLWAALGCQYEACRAGYAQGGWKVAVRGLLTEASFVTQWQPGNRLLSVLAVVLFLNGASPYLGWKFEYSFAMLSNLRADESRWNHVLVPPWVRIVEHDAFVRLTVLEMSPAVPTSSKGKRPQLLRPALYSPWLVTDQLEKLARDDASAQVHLEMMYSGQFFSFNGRADAAELHRVVASLPPKNRLFQNQLSLEGPQTCCH